MKRVLPALGAGLRRAATEPGLWLWLAAPAAVAALLPALPTWRLLQRGLPERPELLERLDLAAAIDLLNRQLSVQPDGPLVALGLGLVCWLCAGHYLTGAAAFALASGSARVGTAELLGHLAGAFSRLTRLWLPLLVLWGCGAGLLWLLHGAVTDQVYSATTEGAAARFERLELLAALLVLGAIRAVGSWALVLLAAQPERRSTFRACLDAARLLATRPGALCVELASSALALAAFALATLPRWLLPQSGPVTLALGFLLALLPLAVRGAGRVAQLSASLAWLAAERGLAVPPAWEAERGSAPERDPVAG